MGDPQSGHGSMPIPSMPLTDIQKWKDFCFNILERERWLIVMGYSERICFFTKLPQRAQWYWTAHLF